MANLLKKTITEAKDMISKKGVELNEALPLAEVLEVRQILKGSPENGEGPEGVMVGADLEQGSQVDRSLLPSQESSQVGIVYPMGLPPHDPIRMEFEDKEDLSGTQASLDVMEVDKATLYWAGKELVRGQKLSDVILSNEKTKLVVKLQKGKGVPAREPVVSELEQKEMMDYYYRRQEELKVRKPT